MKKTLTRIELYTLVWSKPMSQLAIEFEISDVGLKKICKSAYIPTPTLGYWAKLKNGKKTTKSPLPTLHPFQSQMVYIGSQRTRYGYTQEPELTDEQLAAMQLPDPPEFECTIDQAREKIESLVPKIAIPAKITRVHPVAHQLAEAQAKLVGGRYSFHKPKYSHPNGARVFRALNSLFFYFSSFETQKYEH